MKDIKLVKNVRRLYTKRLSERRLSHSEHAGRPEDFNLKEKRGFNFREKRIKFDLILFCWFIYGLDDFIICESIYFRRMILALVKMF